MRILSDMMLWNAAEATLLALAIAATARIARLSPPHRHVLWLLVLIKLLAPPLAEHSLSLSALRARGAQWLVERTARDSKVTLAESSISAVGVAEATDAADAPATLESNALSFPSPLSSDSTIEVLKADPPVMLDIEPPAALDASVVVASDDSVTALSAESAMFDDAADEPSARAARSTGIAPVMIPDAIVPSWPLEVWLTAIWLAGAIFVAVRQISVTATFVRRLRRAGVAGDDARNDLTDLAMRLGLRQPPRLVLLSERISPMLYAAVRPIVIVPVQLMAVDRAIARRSVLAHELAHLKRRDHWVCWLELVASCVFWWLPTFWWARRELRHAADEAADAWAVWALGCRRTYAESLLETIELLVARPAATPALGRGLGERETLARRLTMIMNEPLHRRLSWRAKLGAALLGLVVLPAAPGGLRAQDPRTPPPPPSDDQVDAAIDAILQQPGQPPAPPGRDSVPQPPRGDGSQRPRDDGRQPPQGGDRGQLPQPPAADARFDAREAQRGDPNQQGPRGDGRRDLGQPNPNQLPQGQHRADWPQVEPNQSPRGDGRRDDGRRDAGPRNQPPQGGDRFFHTNDQRGGSDGRGGPDRQDGRGDPDRNDGRDARGQRDGGQRDSGAGGSDQERRLREIEDKMDRILHLLQSQHGGQPQQPGGRPGTGAAGFGAMGGFGPGGMMSGGAGGGTLGAAGGGMPGAAGGIGQMGGGGGRMPGGAGGRGGAGGMRMGPGGGMDGAMGMMGGSPPRPDIGQMVRGLAISSEQLERIKKGDQDVLARIEKLEAEHRSAEVEFQKRREELEHKRMEAIREVLSPEQREQLERNRSRGPGGEGRPGAGPGRGASTNEPALDFKIVEGEIPVRVIEPPPVDVPEPPPLRLPQPDRGNEE